MPNAERLENAMFFIKALPLNPDTDVRITLLQNI